MIYFLFSGNFCSPVYDTRRQLISYIAGGPLRNGSIPVGTEIQIECVRGHDLSDPTLKFVRCRESGWAPALPRCLPSILERLLLLTSFFSINLYPENCNLPSRENGFFMYLNEIVAAGLEIRHSYGAQMFCLKEFELHGNDILECNLGQFLKPAGQCVPSEWQLLNPPLVGSISNPSNNPWQSPVLCHICVMDSIFLTQYRRRSFMAWGLISIVQNHSDRFQSHKWFTAGSATSDQKPPCAIQLVKQKILTWLHYQIVIVNVCNHTEMIRTGRQRQPLVLYSGCDRPMDVESAWIYRELVAGNQTVSTLIDPEQSVFPNQTVVHYKCLSANVTNNHEAMQANAVKCVNGDWIAQLVDCGMHINQLSFVLLYLTRSFQLR